ncbi:helix-turn-helix domain-containing protein [Frankia sp. AgB32]|uniref:helix-turn-helix domain-containing protein n=1 Tax=Frankia sp. AgB32 TaxID=631119 RepID=UPI00200BADB9|nr:helix-turn-helix domain-containing protein [Frankia sp. AgB32]MCK9897094.1 helix-turn-helix domain-containing protein [Frankia sp. AgB32]
MKGLLLKLSALDSDAESAVRVIAYFDALVATQADVRGLVRAAAMLAECDAGLETPEAGRIRYGSDGRPAPSEGAMTARVSGWVRLVGAGRVWLERPGPARALDEIVLERMAITARIVSSRARPSLHTADPSLAEVALSDRESAEDRARALRLMGLLPEAALRMLAVTVPAGMDPGVGAVALVARGHGGPSAVRVAVLGHTAAVFVQDRSAEISPLHDLRASLQAPGAPSRLGPDPTGMGGTGTSGSDDDGEEHGAGLWRSGLPQVGIGGPVDASQARISWRQALLALRFTSPGSADTAVVDYPTLGSTALLADVPVDRLRADMDVRALDDLARTTTGATDLTVLDVYCRAGSLRLAATSLHLHHSSVAARIAHLEDLLGWRLDEPEGRFRARLALLARRLAVG